MVPAEEDVRHPPAVPLLGAAVLGVLQQTVPVALVLVAGGLGQYAGHHPAHRVRHRHGWNFPAGEDEVPHGDLLVHALLQKTLVHALVVSADQNEVVVVRQQLPGLGLAEGGPAGGEIDGAGLPRAEVGPDIRPAAVQRVRLHDGPPASAVGVVVHLFLLVDGEVPDLVGPDADEPPLLGPAQDGLVHHIPHRIGEQGHDVNSHGFPGPPSYRRPPSPQPCRSRQ